MGRAILARLAREQLPEGPRRALVLLLLEDPDARLCLNHACELLTSRGVAFGDDDGLAGRAAMLRLLEGGSNDQGLHPACLRLERSPSTDAVVRLDVAGLVQHLRSNISDPEALELLGAAWSAEHSRLTPAVAVDHTINHMALSTNMLSAPVMPIIHTLASPSPPLTMGGAAPHSGNLHQYVSMAVSTPSVSASAEHPALKGSSTSPLSGPVDHHLATGLPTNAIAAVAVAARGEVAPPAASVPVPDEHQRDLLLDSDPTCSAPTSVDSSLASPLHNTQARNDSAAASVALALPAEAGGPDGSPPPSNPGPTTAGALAEHLYQWQAQLMLEPSKQSSSGGGWGFAQSCDEPLTTSAEFPVAQSGAKSRSSPVSHDDHRPLHQDASTPAGLEAPADVKHGASSDGPAVQGSSGQLKGRTSDVGALSKSLITAGLQQQGQPTIKVADTIHQASPAGDSPTNPASDTGAAVANSPSSCDEVLPGFGGSRSAAARGGLWSAAAAAGRAANTGVNNNSIPVNSQMLQPAGSNASQVNSLLSTGSGGSKTGAPGMLAASTHDSGSNTAPPAVWDALSSAHQLMLPYQQQQQLEHSQHPKLQVGQYSQLAGHAGHPNLPQQQHMHQLHGNMFQRGSMDSHPAMRFHQEEQLAMAQQPFQHPLGRSYDEVPGGTGNMDLDTALEALLSYESAAKQLLAQQQHQQHQAGGSAHGGSHFAVGPGSGSGGGVSAATAVAAQHTLNRHVAAAVRAAAAVHDRNSLTATLAATMNVGSSQPPTPPFYSQPASQDVPNNMLAQSEMHNAAGWGQPLQQQQQRQVSQHLHSSHSAALAAAMSHSASTNSMPAGNQHGGGPAGNGSLDGMNAGPNPAMWGVLGGNASSSNATGNLHWISGPVNHSNHNALLGTVLQSGRGSDARTVLSRLNPRIRTEVLHLLLAVPSLKLEDFDENVLLQLVSKRSEDEAVGALRTLAASGDTLAAMPNVSAYLAHVIQSYQLPGGASFASPASLGMMTGSLDGNDLTAMLGPQLGSGSAAGTKTMVGSLPGNLAMTLLARQQQQQQQLSGLGLTTFGSAGLAAGILAPGGLGGTAAGQSSLANLSPAPAGGTFSLLPSAVKVALQRLPPRVLRRLEEVVAKCSYMDWKHFDAGVVKVMHQLSELCESDVIEELQLLEATDLSNVEYMPAYLNKRLNNRLWSRRKTQQQQQQQQAVSLVAAQHLVGL